MLFRSVTLVLFFLQSFKLHSLPELKNHSTEEQRLSTHTCAHTLASLDGLVTVTSGVPLLSQSNRRLAQGSEQLPRDGFGASGVSTSVAPSFRLQSQLSEGQSGCGLSEDDSWVQSSSANQLSGADNASGNVRGYVFQYTTVYY